MDRIAVCGTVDPGSIPGRRTMAEHIANRWLKEGLSAWKDSGAKVYFLEKDNLRIPVIDAPAMTSAGDNETILAGFGLHLEETSGIKFVLNPDNFEEYRRYGKSFLIFPIVNQYGLKYPDNSHEILLRYDAQQRNYNDGWGDCEAYYKPREAYLVEDEIRRFLRNKPIRLCVSYHEDSEMPKIGYIYTVGINETDRRSYAKRIKARIDDRMLAKLPVVNNVLGGMIEHDMVVAEEYDPRALENWVYYSLGIPSVLVEGPFGLELEARVDFQRKVTESVLL